MPTAAITVVVPVRDRPNALRQLLASVGTSIDRARCAGWTRPIDVLVVDDRSVSPPRIPIGVSARVISSELPGPGAARNAGAAFADSEWLLFTDSDCVVDPDWIAHALRHIEEASSDVVQGDPTRYTAGTRLGAMEQALYRHMYSAYLDSDRRTTAMLDSRNLLISRERLLSVGGFPTDGLDAMAESRVLAARLREADVDFSYDEEIIVTHCAPASVEDEMRAKFRHGRGRLRVWGDTPPPAAALASRYFTNPVRSGVEALYVIPVHIAFLAGYSFERGLLPEEVPLRALGQAGDLDSQSAKRALAWLARSTA